MDFHKVLSYLNESESDSSSSTSTDSTLDVYYPDTNSSDSSTNSYTPRRKLHRITSYMETVEEYDEDEFREHFRMKRSTCQVIIDQFEKDKVLPVHNYGRENISAKKAFYLTLWYLGNTETYRQISDRFNVTKSSAYRTILRVVNYLVNHSIKYITWPNEQKINKIRAEFQKHQAINGIVGAIDGCHINIKRPRSKHSHVYYNRKGDYSILLQGVCDNRKRFIDVFCGEPGSIHDSRLLKKSSLYEKCLNGLLGNNFLLGDSAYPCLEWLIPPFKDNGNLSENQKIFNYRHSSVRIVIENAFGLLKGRFRRLKRFENDDIMFIAKCVVAACVLHNICIDYNDEIEPDDEEDFRIDNDEMIGNISGIMQRFSKREEIFSKMFS